MRGREEAQRCWPASARLAGAGGVNCGYAPAKWVRQSEPRLCENQSLDACANETAEPAALCVVSRVRSRTRARRVRLEHSDARPAEGGLDTAGEVGDMATRLGFLRAGCAREKPAHAGRPKVRPR